jgi:hypothetical protein
MSNIIFIKQLTKLDSKEYILLSERLGRFNSS